jgi:head-tail adaptor
VLLFRMQHKLILGLVGKMYSNSNSVNELWTAVRDGHSREHSLSVMQILDQRVEVKVRYIDSISSWVVVVVADGCSVSMAHCGTESPRSLGETL